MIKLIKSMKGSEGITLIEVIVAMGIVLIGAMAGYSLYVNVYSTRTGNMEVVQAQQDARNIVESMARELRESSPEVCWLHDSEGYNYISFFTPRDSDRRFMVNADGSPIWQRGIGYWLQGDSNELYRYQLSLVSDPDLFSDSFYSEIVARNVEDVQFSRVNDLITISVRTFTDSEGEVGHTAKSYADFRTTVKMRN